MPALFLTRASLASFVARVESLRPDSPRLWGAMSLPMMLAHVRRAFEIWLGDVSAPDQSNWITRTLVRWLVFHSGVPWPKGKVKAPPVFLPDHAADLETERRLTIQIMRRFVDTVEADPARIHRNPFFGPLRYDYLPRMAGMHTDHHLRQFGA